MYLSLVYVLSGSSQEKKKKPAGDVSGGFAIRFNRARFRAKLKLKGTLHKVRPKCWYPYPCPGYS